MDNETIVRGAYAAMFIGGVIALSSLAYKIRRQRRDREAVRAFLIYEKELPELAQHEVALERGQPSSYHRGHSPDLLEKYFEKFPKQREELNHRLEGHKTLIRKGVKARDLHDIDSAYIIFSGGG